MFDVREAHPGLFQTSDNLQPFKVRIPEHPDAAAGESIDTAQSYFNEEEVGNAISKSRIPRDEIFLTTKVWIENYGYEETRASVLESMKKLQVEYLDICLLHQSYGQSD